MNIPSTVLEALLHASNACTRTILHVEDDLIWMVLSPNYRYLIDNIYIYEDPFRRGHPDIIYLIIGDKSSVDRYILGVQVARAYESLVKRYGRIPVNNWDRDKRTSKIQEIINH